MKLLEERIMKDGKVIGDKILKVDSFLNHQIDVDLFNEMGKEFKQIFKNDCITKILTIESSGIAIACIAAQYFKVPVVFAKKHEATNLDLDTYQSSVYSFTKDKHYNIRVAKNYISRNDRILIIDDFLANGNAASGLADIVAQAGAELVGIGIVIEKGFQEGRRVLAEKGIRVESLAIVETMKNGTIKFK